MVWCKIIDQWIKNYKETPYGKIEAENEIGFITWVKESDNLDKIIVNGIYINPEYRRHGYCKQFLIQLIDQVLEYNQTRQIQIQAVLTKILYNFLTRFTYKGKKFKIINDDWTYNIK